MINIWRDTARVGEHQLQIAWVGLEDGGPAWELMSTIYTNASIYPEKNLRVMRLNSVTKRAIERKYGMTLLYANVSSVSSDVVSIDEPRIRMTDFLSIGIYTKI